MTQGQPIHRGLVRMQTIGCLILDIGYRILKSGQAALSAVLSSKYQISNIQYPIPNLFARRRSRRSPSGLRLTCAQRTAATPSSQYQISIIQYPTSILLPFLLLLASPLLAQSASSIESSPHNLSAVGPSGIRAATEQEVCIFCHTPHSALPSAQPLWNRSLPVNAYNIYRSRSLDAQAGQPTGSSKLCLSCHDGTIALGSVRSRSQPILMTGGVSSLPSGRASNLGTDLSDDHPVSFRYDSALTTRDTKLKAPSLLPAQTKLDRNNELQCSTCHDAHNNQFGKFLVMANDSSQLCNSCHQPGATTVASHTNCNGCHQSHSAPSGALLLKQTTASATCLTCHSGQAGQPAGANIAADLNRYAKHDTAPSVNVDHPPVTDVTCSNCHQPHTMKTGTAVAPNVPRNFGDIAGVTASGAAITPARYEFEVCFKCHGDQQAVQPMITRQLVQANTRLEFDPSAISFHPVEAAGRSNSVPSLIPPMTTASIIYCNDCHNSNAGKKSGGAGPNGVHGSDNAGLLIARYDTTDNTAESAAAYALCYRCHNRNSILGDQSFKEHKKHIVEEKAPCSACHDAHGIASAQGNTTRNSHLINFDTKIVKPNSSGRLYFEDRGNRAGACYLSCHGDNHNPEDY